MKNNYINKINEAEMLCFDNKIIDYHFLFNSLETINSLALSIGASEICKLTLALANMIRFIINDNQTSIILKDEMDFVNEYLTIQSIRFNENLTFEINSSHSMTKTICPKFLIQAIVSRVIYYYIEKNDMPSHIKITVEQISNLVAVIIENNLKEPLCCVFSKKELELFKKQILEITKLSKFDKRYDIEIIDCNKTGITVKVELEA